MDRHEIRFLDDLADARGGPSWTGRHNLAEPMTIAELGGASRSGPRAPEWTEILSGAGRYGVGTQTYHL
jgi:hypothetical protein